MCYSTYLLDAQNPGDPGPLEEERLRVKEQYSYDWDDESSDGEPEYEDGEVDGPELPGDDGHPGGEEGHGHGEGKANQVIWLLHLFGVGEARDLGHIVGCGVVTSWGGSGEEGWGSGDDDHSNDQTGPDQEPVHAAVLLEEDGGQQEGHRGRGEEDGGAVAYGQPLNSLEYGEEHDAAHHGLRCYPPPGGEVWRGQYWGPGEGSGSEEHGLGYWPWPPDQRQHPETLAQAANKQHLPGAHCDVETSELDADVAENRILWKQ